VQEDREGRVQLLLAARRMKPRLVVAVGGILAAAALTSAAPVRAPFEARVVGVVDGDSIAVLAEGNDRLDVRLDGIDAPELGQDFGRRARQFTAGLLFGRTARVVPKSLDRYGRTVARVEVDGRDSSSAIVSAGTHGTSCATRRIPSSTRRSGPPATRGEACGNSLER
jgi:endonuclease YncB( thermonuclease family)